MVARCINSLEFLGSGRFASHHLENIFDHLSREIADGISRSPLSVWAIRWNEPFKIQ
jgi:hypothetical protein